ncbi:diguanylate cyclase domain-containing protein [Acetobacterium wieringae]|uniref:GGDEF domain-containing protein n=1 Tax=Acetobacterium wieringae TaxID=52694 RepID=UPI0026EE5DBB|nr:diguanylate cyclase [Acetobacterium wieringae]
MNYLLLRASMQDMVVYLDGQEIQRVKKPETRGMASPLASTWVMFKLPQDFQEKTLRIILKSDVAAFSGHVNMVMIGDSSSLVNYVFEQGFGGFLVFLVLFVMGLLLMLFATFTKSLPDNRFLYLGLLMISTSVWILSEARILQFFIGNRYIIGGISYLMVPLMGGFFSLYVKEAIFFEHWNKRLMQMMAGLYLFLLIATIILQVLGISEFIEIMNIILMVIFFNIIIFSVLMFEELVKKSNQDAKQFFKYVSVLSVSVIIEGIVFYTNQFDYTSFFIRVGSLIFFCLLLIDSYLYVKKSLQSQKERDLYEALAYQDVLTGGNNRAAFERDFEMLRNKEMQFRLVLLDLNELKFINDNYGHGSGDEAIKTLYVMMHDAFMPEGICYRIGGDEFAILMENTEEAAIKLKILQMNKYLKCAENQVEYPLEVAIGTDVYDAKTWSNLTKFYHHVDQQMYADKLERKQIRKTKLTIAVQ